MCIEITHLHLKGNVGESLVGAALVEELVSLGDGAGDFPLPVALVRVEVDGRPRGSQVHLTRVVRPSTEYQLTHLKPTTLANSQQNNCFCGTFEDTTIPWL